jgi:outer membrane protein assembly factor BamD
MIGESQRCRATHAGDSPVSVDGRVWHTYHTGPMFRDFGRSSLNGTLPRARTAARTASPLGAARRASAAGPGAVARGRIAALVVALLASLAVSMGGCASSEDATKPVTYSLTAKQNYEKGLAELKDENYPEAAKYFQFVRSKFPFSRYAVLAELALADTQFARGNYSEAADSYKQFMRLHPTHSRVTDGYAAFKVGECYFKDMPDDVWLLPPSYEKDQSSVTDALHEMDEFVKKYPDSPYVEKVQPLRREALKRLVDHEVYVARFYLDRDYPKAAAMRLQSAIHRYPGSGREPELLLALGETYLQMGDVVQARDTFQRVIAEFPRAGQARRGELYLDFIRQRYGDHPPGGGHG